MRMAKINGPKMLSGKNTLPYTCPSALPALSSRGPARAGRVLMTMATVDTTTNITEIMETTWANHISPISYVKNGVNVYEDFLMSSFTEVNGLMIYGSLSCRDFSMIKRWFRWWRDGSIIKRWFWWWRDDFLMIKRWFYDVQIILWW